MKISDISINDIIITKDNIKGSVIQINSILYLNNIMSKKKTCRIINLYQIMNAQKIKYIILLLYQ